MLTPKTPREEIILLEAQLHWDKADELRNEYRQKWELQYRQGIIYRHELIQMLFEIGSKPTE